METASRTVDLGGFVLGDLLDARGSFISFREGFTADEELEQAARQRWGELFDGPDWLPPFRVFSVVSDDATVLVDAGVGPARGGSFLPSRQGWLPSALEAVGLAPDDVDAVVLTHLHPDHVGWATTDGAPFFPRARYVVSAGEWATVESRTGYADQLGPVAEAQLLDVLEPEAEVAPGVTLVPTPGHTPGHSAVRVQGRERAALVVGDVLIHPLQLLAPDVSFAYDADRVAAARTRRALLEDVADADVVVAPTHFPEPFGRVVRAGDGYDWAPLV